MASVAMDRFESETSVSRLDTWDSILIAANRLAGLALVTNVCSTAMEALMSCASTWGREHMALAPS